MERCSYGFYTKRSEILDIIKKKEQENNSPQSPGFQQKPADKTLHAPETQNGSDLVTQQLSTQQLLSPTLGSTQPVLSKEDSKEKSIKVANSTTITLIENGNINSEKEKDNNYPKNYFTLESKNDKKEDANKNSITITRTVPKQSPGSGQVDKAKVAQKPTKRPLQCLETLAEKAGITFEDRYEAANTLLALDKQNNSYSRRPPELKQPKTEPDNSNQSEEYRYRNQKEEDDKLQIQQQIIQQQQQQQQQQQLLQQHQLQQQLQQLQQQALQRQHQQALQQHIKNQQEHQELLQKQFQQQQQQQQQGKPELQQGSQTPDLHPQKFLQVVNNQPVHTQQFNVPGIGEINLSFLTSPQNNVNLLFDKNQKPGMSGEIKQQQLVDGQGQVVQQQMSMAQHEPSQQHHQTVTVVSSMPSSMAAHQVQQQQQAGGMQQQGGVSTMPPLQSLPPNAQHPQQISAEWGHSRVQVIQQPLQNSTYLQQLYNPQAGPLLMPGNIALHPGINSQQIQVIAAGKAFQGNQLTSHMLTAQGKQVLQGQAAPFPGYTTIPAIPTTQNQTFVFSPLGVINSQPSILPAHSQPTVSALSQQQKTAEMHKVMSGAKVTAGKTASSAGAQTVPVQAQCVQVSQPVLSAQQPAQAQIISPLQTGGQTMQFAPWQISGALPQVWAGGLPAGALPGGGLLAPNPIFIRGAQPDTAAPSMFIHSPQNNLQHATASVACAAVTSAKPRASTDGIAKAPRPLSNILPSSGIRPASSVSTQTASQAQNQAKHRGKPGVRSPAPASKQDAANQTNKMQHQMQPPKQQLLVMNSSGQMTQIASVQDKKPISSSIQQQQQALLQQQALQQQQQQQLLHQQQTQQIVQHYQQQGMTLGMQQGALPVGSVAQTLPMTGMPQTISMVQQIHPLGGMAQPGTLVGQINTSQQAQNPSLTQVQTLQQQPQTLMGSSLVQTSVGMAVQQQATLNHTTPIQTSGLTFEGAALLAAPLVHVSPALLHHEVSANMGSPQLTLGAGGVGLLAEPVQGSMLPPPPPAALVHVKSEDDKAAQAQMRPPPAPAQQPPASGSETGAKGTPVFSAPPPAPAPAFVPAPAPAAATADAAVSTTAAVEPAKSSPSKSEASTVTGSEGAPSAPAGAAVVTAAVATATATPVPSSAQHTTSVAPQVVTTVASSTSVSAMITSAITAPLSSGAPAPLFKSTASAPRHMSQPADKGLPKAMVKPNILTHVIEGYVIQEAGEPFAVNRPLREWSAAAEKDQDKENKLPSDEPPRKKQLLDSSASLARISLSVEGHGEGNSSGAKADGPDAPSNDAHAKIPNANKWTVAEVCEFIRGIPGCAGYADEFLMQEVDGEALLLIRPEHLVMALSMKLGPALKIVACIDSLRPNAGADHTTHADD